MHYHQRVFRQVLEQLSEMAVCERSYQSIESAAEAVAEESSNSLRAAFTTTGRAILAVSGGRTPPVEFERLQRL